LTTPNVLNSLIKSFLYRIFPEDDPDLEKRARKKLFAVFLVIIGIPMLLLGLNHLHSGFIKHGIIDIVVSLVMFSIVFAVNRIKRVVFFYRAISLLLWLLLFYWLYTGAINGNSSLWAILYPIFVFFLLGKREGFIWSASIVVMCALLFYNPFHIIPTSFHYSNDFAVRHLGTLLIVFFLTFYYELVRVRYKDALERDRRELQIHRDNLEALVTERTNEIQRKNIELNNTLEQLRQTTARYLKSQIEKEKMQEQLAHSQKMEAVGTLAGGLAHDFNNLLGGIIGSFNLMDLILKKEQQLTRRDEIKEIVDLGIESSKKSSGIIRQLLTLSRRQDLALVHVDINSALKNILQICKNSFAKSILLDFRITDTPILVMGDPVYMEQVILNLCINGAHAMTTMRRDNELQGGTLTVIPEIVPPDDALLRNEPESSRAVSWARIRVIDTGVGIPEENRDRIFEPFFTTKKIDGGSGLGLAISYGIIKQHGGFIGVQSTLDEGSVFSVYLPVAREQAPVLKEKPDQPGLHTITGSGTILVIDDEAFILEVVRGILEEFGWKALTAKTPDDGVAIFRERHKEIAGVILDLSMPGKTGIELFMELKEIDPGVKAILCSGLIEKEVRELGLSAGIKKILHKPFEAEQLIVMLDELLRGV
jgi:signal transduction histidine kinase